MPPASLPIYNDRVNSPAPLVADAILPSLIWIWPIAVVLLLPIIAVEAQYARKPLRPYVRTGLPRLCGRKYDLNGYRVSHRDDAI